MKPDSDAGFDLYLVRNFFDVETCEEFITEMCRSPVGAATVYGRGSRVLSMKECERPRDSSPHRRLLSVSGSDCWSIEKKLESISE